MHEGVTKLYDQPITEQHGISTNQSKTIADDAEDIVTENGSATNAQSSSEAEVLNEKDDPIAVHNPSNNVPESALEQLANQPDTIEKYNDMTNDVKEMDMIAFKVFTPNFEQSNYIIGLVETIVGRTTADQQDYDLVLQIMGKCMILLEISATYTIFCCCLFSAGRSHIEHLRDPTASDDKDIHIQINRMDIFNAKILTS